jgi:hypothetical protein
MDRRHFLLTSLAGALAGPLAAGAQQAVKVYRLGISSATRSASSATWRIRASRSSIDGLRGSMNGFRVWPLSWSALMRGRITARASPGDPAILRSGPLCSARCA